MLASFVIATGAAALGMEVSMFFTFWGLSVLKKDSRLEGKSLFEKMMAVMTPSNTLELPVSKMNYFGIGAKMLRKMMKDKNVDSLEQMIEMAREMGMDTVGFLMMSHMNEPRALAKQAKQKGASDGLYCHFIFS